MSPTAQMTETHSKPEPLSKQYTPPDHEPRIWQKWLDAGAFAADPRRVLDGDAEPYCILIPPPNVTAALHLGHALNNTLQDILVRAHRMMGYETLWLPGTDHAGIATQTKVEQHLIATEGKRRVDYDRDEFIAITQAWKDEFEQTITDQLMAMGCSCDWDRQRFTMDPVCKRAVREAFFQLFKAGLIERGKRLVNWDPATQTALADDEVEMKEIDGAFYYMRYPLVHAVAEGDHFPVTWEELAARGYPGADQHPDDEQAWLTVATTRPETYLGDTAVAVNPRDPRAESLRGLLCELPLVGRRIPVIFDDYVVLPSWVGRLSEPTSDDASKAPEKLDPKAEFATGFLKVTPAHDPNDWEIGQRHADDIKARCSAGEAVINVMAPDGTISADHGWPDFDAHNGAEVFIGKSREEASKLVIREFQARSMGEGSLLEDIKPYKHSVGHSYRSHVPIEPYLSDQWYCKVTDDRLRGSAQRALKLEQRTDQSLQTWPESHPASSTSSPRGTGVPPVPRGGVGSGTSRSDGSLTFHPPRYAKNYESWHDNLRDWCISRQLWWGHRIPVWSGVPLNSAAHIDIPDSQATTEGVLSDITINGVSIVIQVRWEGNQVREFVCIPPGHPEIERFVEETWGYSQDPDVLDTWFSSALWPLSTLGWPDGKAAAADTGTADFPAMLAAFNPSSVLCTAREIITLWVSRMVMFNRFFLGGSALRADSSGGDAKIEDVGSENRPTPGRIPFHDVFIHAMIQDGDGRKMSKSLGNGVDPLDIIHSHGADAMRYTLCQMTTQTQDVRMPVVEDPDTGRNSSPKFDGGRNFCNKLWNAARFAMMMLTEHAERDTVAATGGTPVLPVDPSDLSLVDRWMLSRITQTTADINAAIKNYQFKEYADALYDLLWRDFCDWYLEAIKPTLASDPNQRAVLRVVLDAILRLLHPVLPFVTEAIHERVSTLPMRDIQGFGFARTKADGTLCQSGWPEPDAALRDEPAEAAFGRVRALVDAIRGVRAAMKTPPKRRITLHTNEKLATDVARWSPLVETLAGVEAVTTDAPAGPVTRFALEGDEHALGGLVDALDAAAERGRLETKLADLAKSIKALEGRLNNPGYTKKAPEHLVAQTRDQLAGLEQERAAAQSALENLG